MMRFILVGAALAAFTATSTVAAAIPVRTPLRVLPIAPGKTVDRVETTRVDFLPGQAMPEHKHNVPVVCFVTKGTFLVSIGADPVKSAGTGDVTIEPAGAIVHYFRNASATEPAQLLCASLAGDEDKVLNVMLAPGP
ncbi:MAG TPA: cupin domain-containing protein [Allosphingosinicella sp.]|jgi:quercetin dioxygenase-like cupin family protein|nr:cupin domain-containing protein [Allosphingosinicella sp.]